MRGMGIVRTDLSVAPPCGERGLKYCGLTKKHFVYKSLPLAGSVD